ncbi:MAG TPA: serine hydrolase, partial [Acidobacteriaceae bacterium]|nr:serine hydrolase [Acidobacteriaceae bacterium]
MNSRPVVPKLFVPVLLLVFSCRFAFGQAKPDLQSQLADIARAHHGKVALYATQLNTGISVSLDPDAVVQTASVVKLTILYEAMEQVRAGKAHWDDKIT